MTTQTQQTLIKVQNTGEQFGYVTMRAVRKTLSYIGKLCILTFGSIGMLVFGFVLGLVRK